MKALVTGATSGIGQSIARKLAKKGWELILTGRNEKVLSEMKESLGNGTEIIAADLAKREEVFRVYEYCKDKNVDMLVNNAGYGLFGKFEDTDMTDELNMIDLNITALHILTKLFLRDFKKNDHGTILNVASIAGFMPGPLMATYYSTKAYVVRLTQSVCYELKKEKSNVKIVALCPGPVKTNFSKVADVKFSLKEASSKQVAKYGENKMFKGRTLAFPSPKIWFARVGSKLAPDGLLARICYKVQKRKIQ